MTPGVMIPLLVATLCAGLFAGAAIYISLVEHPARLSCGSQLAVREFGPSYRRGAVMQASLAVVGTLAGLLAAWRQQSPPLLVGSLLLAAVVPFTLVVILPTNKQLLDPALDARSEHAGALLDRWGHLHAARSGAGFLAFLVFLWRLAVG